MRPTTVLLSSFVLLTSFLYNCDRSSAPRPRVKSSSESAVAEVATASPEDQHLLRLNGGFIQYQNAMMRWNWQWQQPGGKLYPIDWNAVLQSMRYPELKNSPKAGLMMNAIVIKRLAVPKTNQETPDPSEGSDAEFYRINNSDPKNPKDDGPTEEILRYADANKIDVYVGLWEDEQFTYSKLNENYLKAAAAKYKDLAKKVWPLYRAHQSFKGWYIPNELWNIRRSDGQKVRLLHDFLASISGYCRNELEPPSSQFHEVATGKRIAVAPFFDPRVDEIHSPADEVKDVYTAILTGSGVDVLMLQDRVGVLGWEMVAGHLDDYFGAFEEVCKSIKPNPVEFWAVVEIFEPGEEHGEPSDGSRLRDQLCIEGRYASRFIAFDYYHFMNPVVPDAGHPKEPAVLGSFAKRRRLYGYYKGAFVDQDFPPSKCSRP